MVETKTLVGGLIFLIFAVVGTTYFYPYYVGTDYCLANGVYGLWEPASELQYFNDTFPAIGRYWCGKEAVITKGECEALEPLVNQDGCKWGGKTSSSKKMLYVMEDPEVSITSDSIKSYPLIDVGLQKTEGVKMDWIENGLTHKCLGFEITKGITIDAIAGLMLDTASKADAKPVLSKKSLEKWNETKSVVDKCTTVKIGISVNGTDIMNTTCTYKIVIEAKEKEVWTNVKIDATELSTERLDNIKLQDGFYSYCFDVPIVKTAKGYGNAGEVKLVLDSAIYTDRQHSSYWNVSYSNQTLINVTVTETDTNQQFYINLSRDINWKCAFVILNGSTEKELAWLNETRQAFYTNFSVTSGQNEKIKIIHNATCTVSTPQYNYSQIMLLANEFETAADVLRVSSVDALNTTQGQRRNSVYLQTADGTAYTDHGWSISRWSNTSSVVYFYTLKSGTFNNCFIKLSTGTTMRAALGMISTAETNWQYKVDATERASSSPIEQNVWTKFRFHVNSSVSLYIKENRVSVSGTTPPANMSSIGWYYDTKAGDMFDSFFVYRDYGAKNPTLSIGADNSFTSNTVPIVNINSILPTTAYTNNDLNCSFIATDADNNPLSANITWYKDNTMQFSFNISILAGNVTSNILKSANTSVGQVWNCSVVAYDGVAYSVANSTTRTISNGIISVELLNPIVNISVKNGTYILNVQGRKTCNLGDCVNLGQYFGIGE